MNRYPEPPVVLPIDGWLFEAKPKAGCATCQSAAEDMDSAKERGDIRARAEAARKIRAHPHAGA